MRRNIKGAKYTHRIMHLAALITVLLSTKHASPLLSLSRTCVIFFPSLRIFQFNPTCPQFKPQASVQTSKVETHERKEKEERERQRRAIQRTRAQLFSSSDSSFQRIRCFSAATFSTLCLLSSSRLWSAVSQFA
jgi:hypothetical protein